MNSGDANNETSITDILENENSMAIEESESLSKNNIIRGQAQAISHLK